MSCYEQIVILVCMLPIGGRRIPKVGGPDCEERAPKVRASRAWGLGKGVSCSQSPVGEESANFTFQSANDVFSALWHNF